MGFLGDLRSFTGFLVSVRGFRWFRGISRVSWRVSRGYLGFWMIHRLSGEL